jgi:uncharacterized protein YggE
MADHVVVTGRGTASAVPDVVVLAVRVQVEEPDVSTALAGAASAAAAVLDAASEHGVAERDQRTTDVGVHSHWDPEGRSVVGYTAHQRIRLRVRDTAAAGVLLEALAGAAGDAFGVDDLGFEVADPEPLHVKAREAAFADARARAEQYAALAGRPLGPVLRVADADGTVVPAPHPRAMAAEARASMPVAAGESQVHAAVVVRFGLSAAS